MSAPDLQHLSDLDSVVEAFELAISEGRACRPEDFLPERSHPEFASILVELVRVDLENAWHTGAPKSADDYVLDFPDVFANRDLRGLVAYEEFRIRRQAGLAPAPDEYARRLAIDVSNWPAQESREDRQKRADASFRRLLESPRDDISRSMRKRLATTFPEFDIIEELGRGTFGSVFLARQRDLAHRQVVIKVTADTSTEPERLACLQHVGIVPVYSVHRSSDWQAMCMPFLGRLTLQDVVTQLQSRDTLPSTGAELAEWMRVADRSRREGEAPAEPRVPKDAQCGSGSAGASPSRDRLHSIDQTHTLMSEGFGHASGGSYPRAVCFVVSQLADALHHAHRRGLLHRDVKPANILIADDGHPMLLDFNLSSDIQSPVAGQTLVGGTLPYLAPEHLQSLISGGDVTAAADIYSLGVVLFELLTGRRPFPSRDGTDSASLEQMRLDRLKPPVSVRSLNTDVSEAISCIVEKCLHPNSANRYGSAEQLADDLNRELKYLPLKHAANTSIVERAAKWKRRHPRLLSLTTLAVLLVAVSVAGLFALSARASRILTLQAESSLRDFREAVPEIRTALTVPSATRDLLAQGLLDGELLLEKAFSFRNSEFLQPTDDWRDEPTYRLLDSDARREVDQQIAEILFLRASARISQARFTRDDHHRDGLLAAAMHLNAAAERMLKPIATTQAVVLQRADILSASGMEDQAARLQQQAQELPPSGQIDRILLASQYLSDHDAREAIAVLDELTHERPGDYSVWYLLGIAKVMAREASSAEGCFSTCIALNPGCWRAWQDRGILRLSQQNFAAAEADFDQLIHLRADIAAAYLNRALVRHELDRTPEAIADLTLAIERRGPSRAFFLRSRYRHETGDSAGAAEDYRRGLSIEPADELSFVARGTALVHSDPQAALADFQKALLCNPNSLTALQNMAHVFSEKLGQPEAALESLNHLISVAPDDTAALAGRGVLLARLGRNADAEHDAKTLLELQPSPLEIYQAACIYALLGTDGTTNATAAVRLVADALRRQPDLLTIAQTDSDIDNIRNAAGFQEVVNAIRTLTAQLEDE